VQPSTAIRLCEASWTGAGLLFGAGRSA
jgi:hypothetical protein